MKLCQDDYEKAKLLFKKKFVSKILHCAALIEDYTDIYLDLSDQTTPLMKNLVNILSTSNLVIFSKTIKL